MTVKYIGEGSINNKFKRNLRLIRGVTTTTEVDSVYISTDANGFPFSLKELYMEVDVIATATNTADQAGEVAINAGSSTSYFSSDNKLVDITNLIRRTNEGLFLIEAKFTNGHWSSYYYSRNAVNTGQQTAFGLYNPILTQPCTNLTIGDSSSPNAYVFGVGTKITLWGVDV